MQQRADAVSGSARVIARALVRSDPPDIGAGEITAKGNRNFAKLLPTQIDIMGTPYDACSVMHYGQTAFARVKRRLPLLSLE